MRLESSTKMVIAKGYSIASSSKRSNCFLLTGRGAMNLAGEINKYSISLMPIVMLSIIFKRIFSFLVVRE